MIFKLKGSVDSMGPNYFTVSDKKIWMPRNGRTWLVFAVKQKDPCQVAGCYDPSPTNISQLSYAFHLS